MVSVQGFLVLSVNLVHNSYAAVVPLYTAADVAFQGVDFIDIYFCKFLYNSPDSFLEILGRGWRKSFEEKFNI